MMSVFARRITCFSLLAAMLLVAVALPTDASAQCARIKPTRPGEVYLLRGLANIFSLGLDEMGKDLSKAGIENCVFNHSVWESLADDIKERSYKGEVSYPVIIIGHSLGAGAAPRLATRLGKQGIPVTYVVMFDPVEPTVVGANVLEIINYYLPKRKDNKLYPGQTFDGLLENVNMAQYGGFTHLNIDKNKQLHRLIYEKIALMTDPERIAASKAANQRKK